MSGAPRRRRTERTTRLHPWTVCAFGLLSAGFFVAWCLRFRSLLTATAVVIGFCTVAVPALALVWAGVRLDRSDIGGDRYERIVRWSSGGAIVFLAVNALVMAFFPWYSFAGNVAWAHFSLNVGAAGGFLVGYLEARAIQREVVATAAVVRAEQLEEDRELLAYLSDLLRHEVLNSTQIIGGHATLLLEDADDSTRASLETIDRESEELTAVIDDIRAMLNATRTSTGRAVVALDDVLSDEVTELERQFDDVEIEVELEATVPDDVRVVGNEGIRWIFANVLENAVEHNDSEPARVEVAVAATDETVTVRIADNGPGIPTPVRETLFERRSDNHGLGLYLVRILATRYGGRVDLAETGPEGSVFTVTLPRADAERAAEAADRRRRRTGSNPPAAAVESRLTAAAGTAPAAGGKRERKPAAETGSNNRTAGETNSSDRDPADTDPNDRDDIESEPTDSTTKPP